MTEDKISNIIIGKANEVHRTLAPEYLCVTTQ